MKLLGLLVAALVLAPVLVFTQPLPAAPSPGPALSNDEWQQIEHLPHGKPIFVRVVNAAPLDCRFAGATDQYLFCDPMKDSWRTAGFQIERANVEYVTPIRVEHDWHPVVLAVAVVAGAAAGANAVHGCDAAQAAGIGLLVGAITGAVGLGIELQGGIPPPGGRMPMMGVQVNIPLRSVGRVPHVPRLLPPHR